MSCRVWIVPSTNSAFTMSGRMLSTYGATALAHGPTHLGKDKGTPRSPDNFSSCLRKANVGAMTHKCHKSLPNELSKVRQELWRAQCLICVFTLSKPQRKQLSSVQFQSIRLFSIGISWVYHGCVIAGGIVASPTIPWWGGLIFHWSNWEPICSDQQFDINYPAMHKGN